MPNSSELEALIGTVEALFPTHKASLTLTHNDHKDVYQTVEQWAEDHGDGTDNCFFDWVSLDEKANAIETDSVWTLRWYPNTPVGFNCIAASSLLALLRALSERQQEREG